MRQSLTNWFREIELRIAQYLNDLVIVSDFMRERPNPRFDQIALLDCPVRLQYR